MHKIHYDMNTMWLWGRLSGEMTTTSECPNPVSASWLDPPLFFEGVAEQSVPIRKTPSSTPTPTPQGPSSREPVCQSPDDDRQDNMAAALSSAVNTLSSFLACEQLQDVSDVNRFLESLPNKHEATTRPTDVIVLCGSAILSLGDDVFSALSTIDGSSEDEHKISWFVFSSSSRRPLPTIPSSCS